MDSGAKAFISKEHYYNAMMQISDSILLGAEFPQPEIMQYTHHLSSHDDANFNKIKNLDWSIPAIISGSFLIHTQVNKSIHYDDIDIYFKNEEDARNWAARNNISNIWLAPNNKSFYCSILLSTMVKLNLIFSIDFKDEQDLISRFDIRACAMAYNPTTNVFTLVDGAADDCRDKRIVIQANPRSASIWRLLKYVTKGFKIDRYQTALLNEILKLQPNRELNPSSYS